VRLAYNDMELCEDDDARSGAYAHGRIAPQDRLALRTGKAALEPILRSDQRELLGGFESDG
jgi:hypothetical protein